MAIKIKHIQTRFLLQAVLLIVIVFTLLFFMLFASSRKKNTLTALSMAHSVYFESRSLNNKLNLAFEQQKSDLNYVSKSCDQLIDKQQVDIGIILSYIDTLSQFNYLQKYLYADNLTDSLRISLENYRKSFEKTVLSLKEKGNRYEGKVEKLSTLSNLLIENLKKAPDHGYKAGVINSGISNYLAGLENEKLLFFENEVKSVSDYFYENYPSFDFFKLSNIIAQIERETGNIKEIDKRLLSSDYSKGFLVDVQTNYSQILALASTLAENVKLANQRYFKMWNLAIVIAASVLLVVFILSGMGLNKNITGSLWHLLKMSKSLKEGNYSPVKYQQVFYEFTGLHGNIDALRINLEERTGFIERLLNNDFSHELISQGTNDKLTLKLNELREKLVLARQEQEKRDHDNEIRRYINEGLAKFGDIMRINSNNTNALGDLLVRELVKYLGAIQGGMFLIDESETSQLHLISAFAYDRKKYLQKTIRIGDGLIGTCAIEKKTIYLTEVPKDYIAIKSGLGDAPPDNILLVPVIHENDLIGVVEIASLKKLSAHEVELTEQIANSLAATIITVRNNTKTAQLLEKSQQQAVEMAEQEEEMRQNMEELKATQEESARREEEMQGILDAIGSSFYVIEYSPDGIIEHVNDKVTKFLGEPYESIIGRKHPEIFSTSSELNIALFNIISSEKKNLEITESLNLGSKVFTYKHHLSPVISKYGNVIKILNILNIEEGKAK
ncbi:MAG: GAF domain-containing protein [Bacteroidales bacterium]|nr:GAF domain-containing protein [Bacteroidales bacterium]